MNALEETRLELHVDMSRICRVCLSVIVTTSTSIEQVKNLWITCFNHMIPRNDGLPVNICQKCKETLEEYSKFKTQYFTNEEFLLKEMVKFSHIKSNDLEMQDHNYCIKSEENSSNNSSESNNQSEEIEKFYLTKFNSDDYDEKPDNIKNVNNSAQCNFTNENEESEILLVNIEGDEDLVLYCDVCLRFFTNNDLRCKHILEDFAKNSTNETPLQNVIEGDSITNTHSLQKNTEHVTEVSNQNQPQCNATKKTLYKRKKASNQKTRGKLSNVKHWKESSSQSEQFECNICGQTYTSKFYLKYHILKHQGEKNFTCSVCGMSFLLKQYLREHFEMHEPGHYSCESCGRTFTRRVTLKRHRARHRAVRKHTCEICFKAFLEKDHLKNHMVIHTKERDFVCNVCNKGFALKGTLTKHKLTHVKQCSTN